ncbi:MAG: glycosyltransferase [Candidatus Levybacteria bacterium]|nr:glycosyltransferase [Candidatus Levybacteria bacterium]
MLKSKSVIYVNFVQYDNTGRILDFLKDNFFIVLHFSYDHLRLKRGRQTSYLRIFKKGKLIKEIKLVRLRMPQAFLFPSLPLVAIFMITQTIWYTFRFKRKYKSIDYYLTLNAFNAWIGNVLRFMGLVDKTIFWVGDYFPVIYRDWRIKLARWVYWKFDKPSMQNADKLIFTNRRLANLYKRIKILPKNKKIYVVPIGTKTRFYKIKRENCIIGFLGMIKESQGLELILDTLPILSKRLPTLKLEIVGSGPEEGRYQKRAEKFKKIIRFYGFIENQDKIHKIVSRWKIGLAPYQPVKSNESYWGDPSKIKVYLSAGVPVLTTNVSYMAGEIKKEKAGIIIAYNKENDYINAIYKILTKIELYRKNALNLSLKYDYKKNYPKIFEGLEK